MITGLLRRPAAKSLVRQVIRLLRWLAPTRDHVVVSGFPDSEGNAVEVVRRLLSDGRKVVWLTADPSTVPAVPDVEPPLLQAPDDVEPPLLQVVPKASVRGFTAYLTARLTFFTHGLYLSPVPPRRKPVVNLWHGDGPKAPLNDRHTVRPRATLLVSGTRLFGEIKAGFLHVPLDRLLVVGNPRCDQLRRPASDADLVALGLDPARPFLVHMPTFRSSVAVGSRVGWRDTSTSTAAYSSGDMLAGLVTGARDAGVQVVVKPHPLDAEEYAVAGARVLTNNDLARAGVPLYGLLGRAAGLVTDYSSVWTDFLVLDRPIGFVLNDLDDYAGGSRGLNVPSLTDLLPGPALTTPSDCASFARSVCADPGQGRRREVAERIGLADVGGGATDALFAALSRRGVV